MVNKTQKNTPLGNCESTKLRITLYFQYLLIIVIFPFSVLLNTSGVLEYYRNT